MSDQYRLGIDIGGTFTDGILLNETTGEIRTAKVPSTPADPSVGFLNVVDRMLAQGFPRSRGKCPGPAPYPDTGDKGGRLPRRGNCPGPAPYSDTGGKGGPNQVTVPPDAVKYVVHGTTVATNAIIEGNLAKTAFITTDGFRDLLEIQTGIRPTLYDLQFQKLKPLVPRYLCFGVPERLDYRGEVLIPLDEDAVKGVVRELRDEGVESVAVCLLHSYINPEHEQRIGEILVSELPSALCSLSSEVAPEFREYFRSSTTVINAAIRPVVSSYLGNIQARVRRSGVTGEMLVMQSNGGVLTFEAAMDRPVFMVESGPAAGVIAASQLGETLGHENVISFDMGGTTAKAGLIENGSPRVTKDYEVGGTAATTEHGSRGSGYPIRTPVIDLVEIGAGGGSIAWIDSGGILRVGPRSAGADPGPVCYGQGGIEPTITDANLVLGRISPDYFLGGEMRLDVDAARQAINERCAQPLGMDVDEVALGIVEIANSAMVGALRRVSVQRGYDPREFVLVAFGGAGPVHANRLAAELEMPTVLVPMSPGTTSAMGLLVTDIKHDYSVALIQRADQIDLGVANSQFQRMKSEGQTVLSREGVRDEDTRFIKKADMRYVGQSYELTVPLQEKDLDTPSHSRAGGNPLTFPLQEEDLDAATLDEILAQFHQEHERSYGFKAEEEPVEFVALRLSAVGVIPKPQLRKITPGDDATTTNAPKETRSVYFAETNGRVNCPIYDRYKLRSGDEITGPAIIEEVDSTTIIHPDYRATVDEFGNLFLHRA